MFCDQAWWEELVRVGFCMLLLTMLGFLFGDPWVFLSFGIVTYLCWHTGSSQTKKIIPHFQWVYGGISMLPFRVFVRRLEAVNVS